MSKKNDDFFNEKKTWSTVKDELLGYYLRPYFQKVIHTKQPILYVDCFAGKGQFDDGNPGSPKIALDIINTCEQKTTSDYANINSTFIDLNYADDLKLNLAGYKNVEILSGKYEDLINGILAYKNKYNVFLYIDPYGIKALNCALFDSFSKRKFNSIELLINMNSFGFIREACHALGTNFDSPDIFDDLVEYDTTKLNKSKKSVNELNDIAGGEYWQQIIADKKSNKIDGYQAEQLFSESYCKRLMQSYKYVLNMPLRIKQGQHPKYRMIHATNHRDGCLLMVDNICCRWQALQHIQTGGQLSLFEETYDNEIIDDSIIEQKVEEFFSKIHQENSLHDCLADFYVNYGAVCKTTIIKDRLKEFNKINKIVIRREPAVTDKGKETRFMDENKNQKIFIRWNV